MVNIYILQLEENKYYIGKTLHTNFRLEQHFNSNGSAWSKKYKPIKVIGLIPDCDNYDEDKYTIKYMEKHGINNVRGGSFCEINLSDEHITTIKRMINGSSDNCYMCGSKGHFIKDCKINSEKKNIPVINDKLGNEKCDCLSSFLKPHRRKKCLINNITQTNKTITPEKQNIIQSPEITITPVKQNIIQTPEITITPVKQDIIQTPEKQIIIQPSNITINIIQSENKLCERCERNGHSAKDCFAKKHVNGKTIPDINVFYCSYCNKEFDTQKGATYHENIYCKQKKKSPKKESNDKCYKCGRVGHYSNDCYASTHINGKYL